MKQNLLVIDGDQQSRRVLEVSLRKAGYNVAGCPDVSGAFEVLTASRPDLILADTRLPDMSGFDFVGHLKKNPDWSCIPFMFLSSDGSVESKIRGLELGVEDYLTKPIYIREVLARVMLELERTQREGLREDHTDGEELRLSGALSDMGMVDLLQTIQASKKSGVLYVISSHGRRGAIFFDGGAVSDAAAGALAGEEALYELLFWVQGSFDFEFRPVREGERTIEKSTEELIQEGMRRVDEWGWLLEQTPPLNEVAALNGDRLRERQPELPDELNEVLRHVDGQRTFAAVIEAAHADRVTVLRHLSTLHFEGIVHAGGRPKADGRASSKPPRRGTTARSFPPPMQPPPPVPVEAKLPTTLTSAPAPVEEADEPAAEVASADWDVTLDSLRDDPEVSDAIRVLSSRPPPAMWVRSSSPRAQLDQIDAEVARGERQLERESNAIPKRAPIAPPSEHDAMASALADPFGADVDFDPPIGLQRGSRLWLWIGIALATIAIAVFLARAGGAEEFSSPSQPPTLPREVEVVPTRPTAVQIVPPEPTDEEVYQRLLDKAHNLRGRAAEAVYRRALKLNPEGSEAHAQLGFLLLARGRAKEAARHAQRAARQDPSSSMAWVTLGASRQQLGDRRGAERAYRACVKHGKGRYVSECRAMIR